MRSPLSLHIRPLDKTDEYYACEEVQKLAWQDEQETVAPAHMLLAVVEAGGLALGAFDAAGQLLGFVLGLLARQDAAGLYHHSHLLAVHPQWWGHGIGYRLKLAQRQAVLGQGLTLITWTFDPLERRNAVLNFVKLGVICDTYLKNLYGDMRDGLNAGLPTDRFKVRWQLRSPRVLQRLKGARPQLDLETLNAHGVPLVNPATHGPDGWLYPCTSPAPLEGERLLVQVPADLQALKRADLALARAWRETSAAHLCSAFARGYAATEYLHQDGHSYYLLQKHPLDTLITPNDEEKL
jgi:predicted GNAT superfamily acetyltransferase